MAHQLPDLMCYEWCIILTCKRDKAAKLQNKRVFLILKTVKVLFEIFFDIVTKHLLSHMKIVSIFHLYVKRKLIVNMLLI